MLKFKQVILLVLVAVVGMIISSCERDFGFDEIDQTPDSIYRNDRLPSAVSRRALILYSAGFNSLSSYLASDIEDFKTGYLPKKGRNENMVFIVSRLPEGDGKYSKPTSPVIIQLYKDNEGNPVMDTVLTMNSSSSAASTATMKEALSYIKDNYPAKSYGMVFSSHATGWLPKGYYNEATASTFSTGEKMGINDPNLPAVKSVGQDSEVVGTRMKYYEMNINEFASALPMHFEYILFDACLMGGIEVAYELKDCADQIGFSQTEVLASGFDYTKVAEHLVGEKIADTKSVCSDYFDYYDAQTGLYRSATISLVDCSKLETLASACKSLFDTYSGYIAGVNPSSVQRYFRFDKHWFYDLEDILVKSKIPSSELSAFSTALNDCIIYKAATPSFIDSFDIKTYSGFSMYLPCNGDDTLDAFYKKLEWNKATLLVK